MSMAMGMSRRVALDRRNTPANYGLLYVTVMGGDVDEDGWLAYLLAGGLMSPRWRLHSHYLIPEGFIACISASRAYLPIQGMGSAVAWESITDFTTTNHVEPRGFRR
jgi:hypothetical protein